MRDVRLTLARMNDADESELFRLCAELERINDLPISQMQREALKKAALALTMVFDDDLRGKLEATYKSLGKPLSEDQRQHLASLGIDPDAD